MNAPQISIVIPAYNAEETIEVCLQSIIASVGDARGVEIICVDDGSKDDTGRLIDEIAEKNPMVRPVHKQNGGASSARNAGLDAAQGAYVMFCDADDEYGEGTIACILEDIDRYAPDYIAFKRETVTLDGGRIPWSRHSACGPLDMTWDEYLNTYLPYKGHTAVVFNKVYRREILESNRIRFDTGLVLREDFLFNLLFLEKADILFEDTRAVYHQKKTRGSLTTKGRPDFYEQDTKCLRRIQSDDPELAETIRPLMAHSYITAAEQAVRRILSGRDVPPAGKKREIKRILSDPEMRALEKGFDYTPCDYLGREMKLLLNNKIALFKLRFMTLPRARERLQSLLHPKNPAAR